METRMLEYNWKSIAAKAWSMWAFYAIVLLQVAPEILSLVAPINLNPFWFDAATALAALAGVLGRLVIQSGVRS